MGCCFSSISIPPEPSKRVYTTGFDVAENPLSESGAWLLGQREGVDWADVRTIGGNAIGKNRTPNYSDPTAILAGTWAADQEVEAVVFRTGTGTARREIELRLRATLTPNYCRNYEVIFRAYNASPNLQIVKWPGPRATSSSQFVFLYGSPSTANIIADGDTIKARIVGNTITAYINGVLRATVTDFSSPITGGAPGFGFNYNYEGNGEPSGYSNHGLKSFVAREL